MICPDAGCSGGSVVEVDEMQTFAPDLIPGAPGEPETNSEAALSLETM